MSAFDQQGLAKAVKQVLKDADIPADHKIATVGVIDENGARVVIAAKMGKGWQIQGSVVYEWDGDATAAVAFKGSW